jgi:hypothetical protein
MHRYRLLLIGTSADLPTTASTRRRRVANICDTPDRVATFRLLAPASIGSTAATAAPARAAPVPHVSPPSSGTS